MVWWVGVISMSKSCQTRSWSVFWTSCWESVLSCKCDNRLSVVLHCCTYICNSTHVGPLTGWSEESFWVSGGDHRGKYMYAALPMYVTVKHCMCLLSTGPLLFLHGINFSSFVLPFHRGCLVDAVIVPPTHAVYWLTSTLLCGAIGNIGVPFCGHFFDTSKTMK